MRGNVETHVFNVGFLGLSSFDFTDLLQETGKRK